MQHAALDLHNVVVFLVAAGFAVPLMRRLGISPVLGFLAVGLAIGPYGLARFSDQFPWIGAIVISDLAGVKAFAELGVVFLLFMIGLELSLARLWHMRSAVFGLGGAQVLLTGTAIAAVAAAFGNTIPAAIILGASLALSSTAIVTELLVEKRRLGSPTGQTCFAVLLLQDLAVLPMLFAVQTLSANATSSPLLSLGKALAEAAIAIVLILAVGRIVIRPAFQIIGRTASREMFIAAVLLVVIGTSIATEKVGLSMALGAFLAGLLFSDTEYKHAVEADIEPFKGLLLALFFVSVGMGIDIAQVAAKPLLLVASVIGLFALKGLIFYPLARMAGRPRAVALESALLLGQGGEFAFLVIGLSLTAGLLPAATGQFMLIVTGLTMVITPLVAVGARRLSQQLEAMEASEAHGATSEDGHLAGHVVIAGYGRVGTMLGNLLASQGIPHLAVDTDARLVARYRSEGAGVVFGNARVSHVLAKVGIEQARALVVTMDNAVAVEQVVAAARRSWPHLVIYARARDGEHASRLFALGASHVIPETIEASLQLGEMVLLECGVPDDAARRLVQTARTQEQIKLESARTAPAID